MIAGLFWALFVRIVGGVAGLVLMAAGRGGDGLDMSNIPAPGEMVCPVFAPDPDTGQCVWCDGPFHPDLPVHRVESS